MLLQRTNRILKRTPRPYCRLGLAELRDPCREGRAAKVVTHGGELRRGFGVVVGRRRIVAAAGEGGVVFGGVGVRAVRGGVEARVVGVVGGGGDDWGWGTRV